MSAMERPISVASGILKPGLSGAGGGVSPFGHRGVLSVGLAPCYTVLCVERAPCGSAEEACSERAESQHTDGQRSMTRNLGAQLRQCPAADRWPCRPWRRPWPASPRRRRWRCLLAAAALGGCSRTVVDQPGQLVAQPGGRRDRPAAATAAGSGPALSEPVHSPAQAGGAGSRRHENSPTRWSPTAPTPSTWPPRRRWPIRPHPRVARRCSASAPRRRPPPLRRRPRRSGQPGYGRPAGRPRCRPPMRRRHRDRRPAWRRRQGAGRRGAARATCRRPSRRPRRQPQHRPRLPARHRHGASASRSTSYSPAATGQPAAAARRTRHPQPPAARAIPPRRRRVRPPPAPPPAPPRRRRQRQRRASPVDPATRRVRDRVAPACGQPAADEVKALAAQAWQRHDRRSPARATAPAAPSASAARAALPARRPDRRDRLRRAPDPSPTPRPPRSTWPRPRASHRRRARVHRDRRGNVAAARRGGRRRAAAA